MGWAGRGVSNSGLTPNATKISSRSRCSNKFWSCRTGCRDPLVVWDGILIDGHNRHEICTRLNIRVETVEAKGIGNRDDAKEWIIKNQFGRRNLSSFIRTELALKLEGIFAKRAKEQQIRKPVDSVCQKSDKQIIDPIDTKREIARIAGVSHDTVAKVKKIEAAASPELIGALRSGEISINVAADIATLPAERQAAVVEQAPIEAAPTFRRYLPKVALQSILDHRAIPLRYENIAA